MRIIILIFLAIFLSNFFSIEKELLVEYQAEYLMPSKEELRAMREELGLSQSQFQAALYSQKMIKENVQTQEISLITKGNLGFELILPESMNSEFNSMASIAPAFLSLFNRIYSKDGEINVAVNQKDDFSVTFDSNDVVWNITNEKKEILGIECYKALPKYNFSPTTNSFRDCLHVWFAPSINKRGGPIIDSGLPGLILEVRNKRAKIVAKDIKAVPFSDLKISKKKNISEKEYHSMIAKKAQAIEARIKK
ncbi:MAG: GLPGLI family protein [Bacteroidota bacterium]|nr:GLPGLI family protein [Bacteroidota bacterium]